MSTAEQNGEGGVGHGIGQTGLDAAIDAALAEDRAEADVTTACLVADDAQGVAVVTAKQSGVIAGLDIARRTFERVAAGCGRQVEFTALVVEGEHVDLGARVLQVRGSLVAVLRAERTALNFLQRASGIATLTRRYVDEVVGTRAEVFATRKTAPGLRELDLLGVRAGGARAHRDSLASAVLVKENHLVAARLGRSAATIAASLDRLLAGGGPGVPVGVEVTDEAELEVALRPGVDVVLVDNFDPARCGRAVRTRDERFPGGDGPRIEASGGITLSNVRQFAEAGADRISIGALTHSVAALDLSLRILAEPAGEDA